MKDVCARGFTLVELAVTFMVLGILFMFTIPAFQSISQTYQLKGATENIAAQLRLAREKAIATGVDQPMHFTYNWNNCDYHIHYPSGIVGAMWSLPRGITYYAVTVQPIMQSDGRANSSGDIIVRNMRGARDTVSVQMSGLVITR